MTSKLPPFVFFGTPSVARDTLEHLYKHGIVPKLIVTNPDAARGRGHIVTPSEVKVWAKEHSVPFYTPKKLDADAVKQISSYKYTFGIVVAYGKIFPKELIESFPQGVLNIHYSILPKYRGASPVETALKNGDTLTGVSIQKMAPAIDAGDVYAVRGVSILPEDTACSLRARLVDEGAELLASILPSFIKKALAGTRQDETKTTFAPKIKKEDGLLKISGNHNTNWNTYRAYIENPGVYFFANLNEKRIRVKVTRAHFEDDKFIIERIIPEGKKEQDFSDFNRTGWVPE